ncbi:MAG TPA: hypothetical protein DCW53_00190 [Rikenellaceae bacterium]|nr:hypothetical protein [Rikenellaceae bacterium]
MVVSKLVIVNLIAKILESAPESYNKVLDIVDYLVLYYTFVNVLFPFAQLLDIDVVQHIRP